MRTPLERLNDIAESVGMLEQLVSGLDYPGFSRRVSTEQGYIDAVTFRFVIIGEAVAALLRLADQDNEWSVRVAASGDVDWRGFVRMPNVLVPSMRIVIPL